MLAISNALFPSSICPSIIAVLDLAKGITHKYNKGMIVSWRCWCSFTGHLWNVLKWKIIWKKYIYIYIYESLCCTLKTNMIVNQLYFNKNENKFKKLWPLLLLLTDLLISYQRNGHKKSLLGHKVLYSFPSIFYERL